MKRPLHDAGGSMPRLLLRGLVALGMCWTLPNSLLGLLAGIIGCAFGTRMRGQGPFADLIAMRFAKTRRRLGFGSLPALRGDLFVAPRKASPQGELF